MNKVKITAFTAALVMAFSLVGCEKNAGNTASEVQNQTVVQQKTTKIAGQPGYKQGTTHKPWSELYAKNSDVIGWLDISNTYADDPVVLCDDNHYYLKHAFDKSQNSNGTLYVDSRCIINENYMSQNMTIYGHNLRNGTLFGQLQKYKTFSFYKKNPLIKFDTMYRKGSWKVFAMFITNTEKKYGEIFNYRQPEYDSPEAFMEFIKQVKHRSLVNCPVDVEPSDRIITLSTCTYEVRGAELRFVVMARLVREGESTLVETNKATKNKNPLYFDGWYKVYGGKKPEFND